MVDGAAENELDGAVESKYLLAREAVGVDGRVDAAVEKGFVGVDIADASD